MMLRCLDHVFSHIMKHINRSNTRPWYVFVDDLRIPKNPCMEYLPTLGLFGKLHLGVNVGVHIPAPWILWESKINIFVDGLLIYIPWFR